MSMLRGRVRKLSYSNISDSVRHLYQSISINELAVPLLMKSHSFSSIDGGQDPPDPIPNRPLRGDRAAYQSERRNFVDHNSTTKQKNFKSVRGGGNKINPQSGGDFFPFADDEGKAIDFSPKSKPKSFAGEKQSDFLEKFKLGFDKEEVPQRQKEDETRAVSEQPLSLQPPQDADEIFKKMKETGLIPNAVAMLDGLCKDGLVQEAMKLFGLMREKGTLPEVVIYTAVVEGFCKAQKYDDAKRIFRKMQSNGISPNAFSYNVLIQGLSKGKKLEDAVEFCVEMLEAGHSPNLATFAGLVDGFCREKGLEEAQGVIGTLRQKGFFYDDKAAREYLDKKGPFLPLVWEAILGKKSSQRSF